MRYRAFLPLAGDELHNVVLLLQAASRELNATPEELPEAVERARHFLFRAWHRLADPKNYHRTIVADVDAPCVPND